MATAAGIDYQQLFGQIDSAGNVPYASSELLDRQHGVFQGMYLDLSEIQEKLGQSQFKPPLVTVYADVLNVPAQTSWSSDGPMLFVIARRLQVDGELQVDLDAQTAASATFVLFCAEVEGSVTVSAASGAESPTVFEITEPPKTGGVQFQFVASGPVATGRTWAQGMANPPADAFQQALITEFIFATLLMDSHPAISVSQLSWIKSWAAEAPALLGLFYRSGSLLALLTSQLNAKANRAAFVPYLSKTVYANLASAFVAEAKQYESDYRTLSTQEVVDDQFIAQAKVLLANQVSQSKYVANLLVQAKSNYDNAVASVNAAEDKFTAAQITATATQIKFADIGVEEWEKKQIIAAVFTLAGAIITFGAGIAAVLATGGASAAASAGAAVETVKAVENAAAAGSELAEQAKQLAQALEDLKQMVDTLDALYKFAQGIATAAGDIGNAQSIADQLKAMDLTSGGTDVTDTYQWDIYRVAAEAALAEPVDKGVMYASDLKVAVDDVAIYGQALAAAKLAAITASQNYAAVSWQVQLAAEQQQTLETYVASLQSGEQPVAAMMQQFYQRYIDAKSSLFAAIADYEASFYYWALEPSGTHPAIIDDVTDLDAGLSSLTAIQLDEAGALQRFSPPPQVLSNMEIVIDDPSVLAALARSGSATWSIGLDEEAFDGLDRVRLACVRVWLEGAKPGSSSRVSVVMTTTGTYLDRFDGSKFQFMSKPLERTFVYSVTSNAKGQPAWDFDDGTFGTIEVDGEVDEEVTYAYFRPTPFASWSISLKTHNPGLDLSGVKKITMVFAGSVIGEET